MCFYYLYNVLFLWIVVVTIRTAGFNLKLTDLIAKMPMKR
jgi:hypothetical protein